MNVLIASEPLDIFDNIDWPKQLNTCPSCGIDRAEQIGTGHCAGCFYGTGRNNVGAKEFRDFIRGKYEHIDCV